MVSGTGTIQTKNYGLEGFSRVDAANAFQIEIVQAETFSVNVSAYENLFDYVQVRLEGSTLRLYLDPTHLYNLRDSSLKAKVTMPVLEGIALSGACRRTLNGFKSPKDLAVNLSGASQLDGGMDAGNVRMDVSGASRVTLHGNAADATLGASGASQLNLGSFALNNANVTLSGASSGSVNAKSRLDYDLSGASRLSYTGSPTIGKSQATGASSASGK